MGWKLTLVCVIALCISGHVLADEQRTMYRCTSVLGVESYNSIGGPSCVRVFDYRAVHYERRQIVPAPAFMFHGDECTDDCSGHEAGYEWAERRDITDPDDCGGNSQSFVEGCRSWAEEQDDQGDSDVLDDEVECDPEEELC